MRINALAIENFRAITSLDITDLGDVVVIAGPNGCGKSQIFHAIRFLKSQYGGYQPNEWQKWLGEFQINFKKTPEQLATLFRDREAPVRIRIAMGLTKEERAYIQKNAPALVTPIVWRDFSPGQMIGEVPTPKAEREYGKWVNEQVSAWVDAIQDGLKSDEIIGEVVITPELKIERVENRLLEFVFTVYEPDYIGIFNYQPASRNYSREQVGGIDLNAATFEDKVKQHALYDAQQRFANVKSELAAGFVRELIGQAAGADDDESLLNSLQDLFQTFFPGKAFDGPRPQENGTLSFPVRLKAGGEHDIDELSSGEKEVLFGYLRLRTSTPKNSVLLLDEPELHLNPALLRGFPQFYHRALGRALGNQIWLVTHSDALLREAVGQADFSVFHMQATDLANPEGGQLREISLKEGYYQAVIDLVGDLASYRPDSKIVIFEGGGRTEFDVYVTTSLFPELRDSVTSISGGDRKRVRELHALLDEAAQTGKLAEQFYSVVDRDSSAPEGDARCFSWDRYHIENYLLEPRFIRAALSDLRLEMDEDEIDALLRECAEATLPDLVRHELERDAQIALRGAVRTNSDRTEEAVADALRASIEASLDRVADLMASDLAVDTLRKKERVTRNRLSQDLKNDQWRSNFRGRDILRVFVDRLDGPASSETLSNLIVARMRDAGHRPEGMASVISQILA